MKALGCEYVKSQEHLQLYPVSFFIRRDALFLSSVKMKNIHAYYSVQNKVHRTLYNVLLYACISASKTFAIEIKATFASFYAV